MFVIMLHCIIRDRKRESFCQMVPLECATRVGKGPRDWLWHRAPRLVNPALIGTLQCSHPKICLLKFLDRHTVELRYNESQGKRNSIR